MPIQHSLLQPIWIQVDFEFSEKFRFAHLAMLTNVFTAVFLPEPQAHNLSKLHFSKSRIDSGAARSAALCDSALRPPVFDRDGAVFPTVLQKAETMQTLVILADSPKMKSKTKSKRTVTNHVESGSIIMLFACVYGLLGVAPRQDHRYLYTKTNPCSGLRHDSLELARL